MIRRSTAARNSLKRQLGSHYGYVLIEVLVSMTVFAVGIMAVLTAVLSALSLQKDTALRYRAGLLMQDKLVEVAQTSYSGGPVQGVTADGIFRWMIDSEPWAGAPELAKAVSAQRQETGAGETESSVAGFTRELLMITVRVDWDSSRGTRGVSATELVRAPVRIAQVP